MINKTHYTTFKELFDGEIHYAYEPQRTCRIDNRDCNNPYIVFYKLYLHSNGNGYYKENSFTYDVRLWPKIKLLVELLQETPAEKVLFKNKS